MCDFSCKLTNIISHKQMTSRKIAHSSYFQLFISKFALMKALTHFFELLRFSLDETSPIPSVIGKEEWPYIFAMAKMQAIEGVMFEGIKRLPQNFAMDINTLMQWAASEKAIEKRNSHVNEAVVKLSKKFEAEGFRTCILKGQGNNILYPNPYTRASGDIDIWLEGGWEKVFPHIKKQSPESGASYHHADYPNFMGVSVEIHYRPSFINDFKYNPRLQKWFSKHENEQFCNKVVLPNGGAINMPTAEFNIIMQLCHISSHIFLLGIGLRQLIDYYYLLKSDAAQQLDKTKIKNDIQSIGHENVAGAIMYVLHHALGLDERYMIIEEDTKRGKALLDDIMRGGNFGFYDTKKERRLQITNMKRNLRRISREIRLFFLYPHFAISEPFFRIWHFFWRRKHNI